MLIKLKHFLRKSVISSVKASSLFDADWYASEYGINLPKKDLLSHYLVDGHLRGYDPSAKFNGEAYRRVYLNSRTNPLVHYLSKGRFKGYVKVPSSRYISEEDVIAKISKGTNKAPIIKLLDESSGFFANWYASNYCLPDSIKEYAIFHYLVFGSEKGFDPNPYFSTSNYLRNNLDVEKEMINPFYHYLTCGRTEGRVVGVSSRYAFDDNALSNEVTLRQDAIDAILSEGNFDLSWFNRVYNFSYKTDHYAALHYLMGNYDYSLDPCYSFNTSEYVKQYDDIKQSSINPYLHYVNYGKSEKRVTALSEKARESHINDYLRSIKLKVSQKIELELLGRSKFFCFKFYSRKYKKLGLENSQCAKHYYLFGGFEGKDPSALFSSSYYLSMHEDVLESGMNPLVHYLLTQNTERRAISHSKSAQTDIFGEVVISEVDSNNTYLPSLASETLDSLNAEIAKRVGFKRTVEANVNSIEDFEWTNTTASLLSTFAPEISCKKIVDEENAFGFLAPQVKLLQNRSHNKLRFGLECKDDQEYYFVLIQKPLSATDRDPFIVETVSISALGTSYVDLSLANPYSPVAVLIVSSNLVIDVFLVPFPSLLDGGLHEIELGYYSDNAKQTVLEYQLLCNKLNRAIKNVQRTEERVWNVDLNDARGFEPIFDSEFRMWLKDYWNVKVSTSSQADVNFELHTTLGVCPEKLPQYLAGEIPSLHYLSGLVFDETTKPQHVLYRSRQELNLVERHVRRSASVKTLPTLEQEISALSVDAPKTHINNILGAANLLEQNEVDSAQEINVVINYKSMLVSQFTYVLQMLQSQKGVTIVSLSLIVGETQQLDISQFSAWHGIDIKLYRRSDSQTYHAVLEKVFTSINKGTVVLFSDNVYLYNTSTLSSLVGKLDTEVKIVAPLLVETHNEKNKEKLGEISFSYHIFHSQEHANYKVGVLDSSLALNRSSFVESTSHPLLVIDVDSAIPSLKLLNKTEHVESIFDEAQSLFLFSYAACSTGMSIVTANKFAVGGGAMKFCTVNVEWAEELLPILTTAWKE